METRACRTDMAYDPVQGTGWDLDQARQRWYDSVSRANHEGPKWVLHGVPGAFYWTYFNFQPYLGRVTIEPDGFHWLTTSYATGEVIHKGVTTSIFAAYQSVIQNKPVDPPACKHV